MINYQAVNEFIGKSWVYIENDCWAVVKQASKLVFNREIVDFITFPKSSSNCDTGQIIEGQKTRKEWEPVDSLSPGDIIVFNDRQGRAVHIGIHIEKNNVLHCLGGERVKNGKTRYDQLNVIKLIYPTCKFYRYADNCS